MVVIIWKIITDQIVVFSSPQLQINFLSLLVGIRNRKRSLTFLTCQGGAQFNMDVGADSEVRADFDTENNSVVLSKICFNDQTEIPGRLEAPPSSGH